jgi:hypothetical protein
MNSDQKESQRPTAADFMSDELDYDSEYGYYNDDLSDYSSDYNSESDLDFDTEESYDSFNPTKIFDMKEHFRTLELKHLRLFIKGEYELEEGEIITAFEAISDDEKLMCDLAICYIRTLDGYKKCRSLDDITDFIFTTAEDIKLNSGQALNVHSVLLGEAICQNM